MNVREETELNHRYLVIEAELYLKESFETKMLYNNKIQGLLEVQLRVVEGCAYYYYDVTGKVSLQSRSALLLEKKECETIVDSLCKMLTGLDEYLLTVDALWLKPEGIFYDEAASQWSYIYLPGYCKDIREQIRGLVLNLMNYVHHQNQEAVLYVYGLYKQVQNNFFSIKDISTAKDSSTAKPKGARVKPPSAEASWEHPADEVFLKDEMPIMPELEEKPSFFKRLKERLFKKKKNEEERFWEESSGNPWQEPLEAMTTLLGDIPSGIELISLSPDHYESITITKFPCILGKSRAYADLVIDHKAISRAHAKIEQEDAMVYITDLGSSNGTKVNGCQLSPRERRALIYEDIVELAGQKYLYHN